MAYNGWSYLSTTIAYLDKVSPVAATASGGGTLHNHLVLRGSTELRNVVPHPLTEIVLTLQYVITWGARALSKVGVAWCSGCGYDNTAGSTNSHYTSDSVLGGVVTIQ